jgi:alkylation response protein AidB-like acyl-CoA dehydrogenase
VTVAVPKLDLPTLPQDARDLRADVRAYVEEARAAGAYEPKCDSWLAGFSPEFSQELGKRGWIGMTWPAEYGGHERSPVERYVVVEELLAAGAPVAAHWIADRQSGPQIFRHGSEELKRRVLPAIARGECFFSLGMSEPDSGSDLASVRAAAVRAEGGWVLNGTKVWTSHAHRSHFLTVLCRTTQSERRHDGLSILVVELESAGVDVRPIRLITGEHHFNEVVLKDVFVPDEMLIGEEGAGWSLVTAELALERSGPERFLSTFPLLAALARRIAADPGEEALAALGSLLARLHALRHLSLGVSATIARGDNPAVDAALVKDLGTRFEREVAETARRFYPLGSAGDAEFERLLAEALLSGPGFTLRGGTNEILRGIVAKDLTRG